MTEQEKIVRALEWALYWIARHGIVPVPIDGVDVDGEVARWHEARRVLKKHSPDH